MLVVLLIVKEWVLGLPTALQVVPAPTCGMLVSVPLDEAFRFGFWAISWISTYAGWPNNLKYTPRIQSTIEYMRAVPPYKRWAIKIIEIFSGSAAVHYYYGSGEPCLPAEWKQCDTNHAVSVIFKNSSLFRGGHWGNVKLAAAVAALLTFTSTPFFLFAFYMSARGNVR